MIRVSIYQKKKKTDGRMFGDVSSAYWFVTGFIEAKGNNFVWSVDIFESRLCSDLKVIIKTEDYHIYAYDTDHIFADPIED